ncbi:MAG: phosphatidylserine synthase [Lachnospiraceae bacterium]|nr:phosphatidylserine synthase [Lachnospiraceae bacterium]
MKKSLLGYYDYTVILTYCGMLFAFYGILQVIDENYWVAVCCLMLAGICDMFDGTVAATRQRTDRERKFGIQIDSLSDLISFGILPSTFVYMISGKNAFAAFVSSIFVLCALIRLAYFNVLEEERQAETAEKRKSYLGVPVTTIAVLMPAVYLLHDLKLFRNVICFPILLLCMGTGCLLPVEIKKPGRAGKTGILLLGLFEVLGMLFFMGGNTL